MSNNTEPIAYLSYRDDKLNTVVKGYKTYKEWVKGIRGVKAKYAANGGDPWVEFIENDHGDAKLAEVHYSGGDYLQTPGYQEVASEWVSSLTEKRHIQNNKVQGGRVNYGNRDETENAIKRYNPAGVEINGEPDEGFSVLLVDQNGGLPNLWVDVQLRAGNVEEDWNQCHFNDRDRGDRYLLYLQRTPEVADRAFSAALQYLQDLGYIVQLPNGEWRYGNPDTYAQRRNVLVSLGRKAKANQNRGISKIIGRSDFRW